MANDYFNHVNNRLTGLTRALASSVNNIADEIAAAFDKLPSESETRAETQNLATNIGTADNMVATLGYTPVLVDGFRVRIKAAANNTGASATLNLNGTGVKDVLDSRLAPLDASSIVAGTINVFYYDATFDRWILQSNNSAWRPDVQAAVNDPNEYCPGFPYTFVTTSQWKVVGIDATYVFRVNRRLKFADTGGDIYGAITAVDYNVTSTGDTTITMAMETTGLTDTISAVCLTNSDLGSWTAIAGDPFAGDEIRDIGSGIIGSTVWWVAVGVNGKLFTSTDKGANWQQRTTGTSETINGVAFDDANERFMAIGTAGIMLKSTNGSTWTLDTTTIPTVLLGYSEPTVNDEVYDIEFAHGINGAFMVRWNSEDDTFTRAAEGWTTDFGVTWTRRTGAKILAANRKPTVGAADLGTVNNQNWYISGGETSSATVYTSLGDTSDSVVSGITITNPGQYTMKLCRRQGGTSRLIVGNTLGEVDYGPADTVTFSGEVRDICGSIALNRYVIVCDKGELGYLDEADAIANTADAITFVANPFLPSCRINAVHYNEDDAMFIAVADNGQICRSQLGT